MSQEEVLELALASQHNVINPLAAINNFAIARKKIHRENDASFMVSKQII